MRAVEKAVDAGGLTYDAMMANAGRAVAEAIRARLADVAGKRVTVLAGSGNNGGDGLVAGFHLAEAGAQVSVYLTKERPENDENLKRLKERGILIAVAHQDQRWRVLKNLVASADIVLDSLLGTGFRLPLSGEAKEVLEVVQGVLAKRERLPFVVAVDCPSGLDCDSGEVASESLRADLTVTLAAAKSGLLRFPGAGYVGELVIADIGVASDQAELKAINLELASAEMIRPWLPDRPRDAHKGTFGRALIVAGSVNFPGAVVLAGESAYRVGAGLVTLAVPSEIQSSLVPRLPEATWILLPHELGAISEEAAEVLEEDLAKSQALLVGPGFGQDSVTAEFLKRLLREERTAAHTRIGFLHGEGQLEAEPPRLPPTVLDADGLKLVTQIPEWWKRLPRATVLTPHPGEMAVLTGETKESIQADRVQTARHWAAEWGHVVVLKGAFSVVASPDGAAAVLPFATAALARAGTGDVLAGAIVGLLAQGVLPYQAAVLGAYLHARAGEIAAEELETTASVLAGDVADALPAALSELGAPPR
jgi:NAD(P)H-hydrate epimerase